MVFLLSNAFAAGKGDRTEIRRCYVIVLNWNGWALTLPCLESLFRQTHEDKVIVVCDNGSNDGSLDFIAAWAEGRLDVVKGAQSELTDLWFPPISKPVSYIRLTRMEAAKGGDDVALGASLVLIENGANLGYGGGCNVGLQFALARHDFEFVWILNNDVVVTPDSLGTLIDEAERDPDAGIIGSTVLYFDQPATVQALGGAKFNFWFASARPIGWNSALRLPVDRDSVLRKLDYIAGAAMFVTRRFLQEAGLIPEHFFLYFEEISWALAGQGHFRLGYAPCSIVYHHEGFYTGIGRAGKRDQGGTEFLLYRNRLIFARRYLPIRLPVVYAGLLFAMLDALYRRDWRLARTLCRPDLWAWPRAWPKGGTDG